MDVQTQVAIKLQQAIQKAGYVIIHMLIRCIVYYYYGVYASVQFCWLVVMNEVFFRLPMQQQQHTEAHMRRHLYGRKNDTFSGKVLPQSTVKMVDEIIAHCYCRIPEINGASSKCLNWFHLFCTDNVTEECINDSKVVLLQLQLTCQHHTKMY